ncbi:MAG TPA: hypothetical protein VN611_13620 [Patescibacteria group bacterium]|nr:hypothetical protein [Patescibacteria group bacterium]
MMMRENKKYQVPGMRLLLAFSLLVVLLGQPTSAAAADGDLQRVVINVIVENPDYFWKYPFQGQPLDTIRVSGVGRTINISPQTNGEKMELDVPKGYKFRIYFELQNAVTTMKYVYMTKRISGTDKTLDVVLKAPESQPVVIVTPEWEQLKQ